MSWEIIDNHRENARSVSFDILIWGPSESDSVLYPIREEIKDFCSISGHSAKFSEELINEGNFNAAPNPLTDEFFHADAANIIIILYESRGTQTEYDRILKYEKFLRKSLIFIETGTWKNVKNSISKNEWNKGIGKLKILEKFNDEEIIEIIKNYLEELQFSEYLRNLEIKLLSKN